MNSIDSFPADDLALRPRLPTITDRTGDTLIHWAMNQRGSMPWLLKRTAAYWEKFGRRPADADHYLLDCTAALDLANFRFGTGDRATVEHLLTDLGRPNNKVETTK